MVAIDDGYGRRGDLTQHRAAGVGADRLDQLVAAEPVVRRICRSRLGYWDGDDAAQEALLSTWRAVQRPGFEDRGTLVPYAATAARSFSGRADRWRAGAGVETKRPRPALAGDQTEWGDAWFDPAPGPDEVAEHAEDAAAARRRVGDLLGALTPRQREAVHECALRERDTDQVADELGLRASSVRSSQVRAMARMRELCGARSTNPLAANRSAGEQYARRRQEWERIRAEREQEQGRVIPRRASRHHAARLAAGQDLSTPSDTPTDADTDASGAAPVARASAAVDRARRSVADGIDGVDDIGASDASYVDGEPVAGHGQAADERSDEEVGVGAA